MNTSRESSKACSSQSYEHISELDYKKTFLTKRQPLAEEVDPAVDAGKSKLFMSDTS